MATLRTKNPNPDSLFIQHSPNRSHRQSFNPWFSQWFSLTSPQGFNTRKLPGLLLGAAMAQVARSKWMLLRALQPRRPSKPVRQRLIPKLRRQSEPSPCQ